MTEPENTVQDPRALLEEADALIRMARHALMKMGLDGRGNDLSLPHEVRMFARDFSSRDPQGSGSLMATGTGRAREFLNRNHEFLFAQPKG